MLTKILEKYRPVWAPEGSSGGSSASGSPSGGGGNGASSGSPAPSSAPSSPSGGSASPAPTPSSGSPAGAKEAQSSPSSSTEDLSFETIFGSGLEGSPPPFVEGGEAPPTVPPTVPPQPTKAPAVAAPPAAPPVAPVVAPAEPPVAQAAPGASPPQAGQEAQPLDPFNPGQLASHLASVEANAINFVAEQMFALTPEDREAIETDVVSHIPKMLARVFVKSQQNVLQQFDRLIPVMVQRHTDAMKRNASGEDKFYDRWKNIGREHSALVNKYAGVYRQMHPSATLDQMIEDLGPMIMMAARIAPSSPGAPVAGQPAIGQGAAAVPNGRPPQPTPFVPAGSGGGPASQTKTEELNPWEAMFVGRE